MKNFYESFWFEGDLDILTDPCGECKKFLVSLNSLSALFGLRTVSLYPSISNGKKLKLELYHVAVRSIE